MNKKLAGFILSWAWYYKKERVNKSKIRGKVSEKFRDTKEYKSGKHTTEMFCKIWDELKKMGRIK